MGARGVHVEPLELRLLVDDDEVHVALASQAVVRDGEQTVRIRGQVDARDRALLGQDRIHESRSLMTEAVVIISPAGRREEVVE